MNPHPQLSPHRARQLWHLALTAALAGITAGCVSTTDPKKNVTPWQREHGPDRQAEFRSKLQEHDWDKTIDRAGSGGATNQPVVAPSIPTPAPEKAALPGTEAAADKKLYTFKAADLELKAALALFAQANGLNIVPDNEVTGSVTLDVRDLPLESIMRALLEANDYSWNLDQGLIRVRAHQTQTFQVDYLRMNRTGTGTSSANLASTKLVGGGQGGGGGGGGGGGESGGGGGSGGGKGSGSTVNLTAENPVDFWKELQGELEKLVTPKGKEGLAVNMTAGIIQVTDRPSALKRVETYIKSLDRTIHRQVDIEARLYDVTLNDQFQFGIDWSQVARMYGGGLGVSGATLPSSAAGGFNLKEGSFSMVFQNQNTSVMLDALQEMGEVKVISNPRIRTMNNQTSMIKVGTEMPFFTSRYHYIPVVQTAGGTGQTVVTPVKEDDVQGITVGTILAITPQVSVDDWVTLDISPVLTSLLETRTSPGGASTAPVLDIKQASTLIRVRNGSTIVMGGLIQTTQANTRRKVPVAGDIPLLGKLFNGRFDAAQKRELVMLITPRIVD